MPNYIYHAFSGHEALDGHATPDFLFGDMSSDFAKMAGTVEQFGGITNPDLYVGKRLHHITDNLVFDELPLVKEAGQLMLREMPEFDKQDSATPRYTSRAGLDMAFDGVMLDRFGEAPREVYLDTIHAAADGDILGLDKITDDPAAFDEFIRAQADLGATVFNYYSTPQSLALRVQRVAERRGRATISDEASQQTHRSLAQVQKYFEAHVDEIHRLVVGMLQETPILSFPRLDLPDGVGVAMLPIEDRMRKYAHFADVDYVEKNPTAVPDGAEALYLLSRLAMRQALFTVGLTRDDYQLPRVSKRPAPLPAQYVGSLSHTDKGYTLPAAAAIAALRSQWLGAGIDLESQHRLWTPRTLRAVVGREFNDDEQDLAIEEADIKAAHSIKEASKKAVVPLRGRDVAWKDIVVSRNGEVWQARLSDELASSIGDIALEVGYVATNTPNNAWRVATALAR